MTEDQDTTPRCTVCGVPWAEHDGPMRMCERLRHQADETHETVTWLLAEWRKCEHRSAGRAATIRRLLAEVAELRETVAWIGQAIGDWFKR